MKRRNFIKNSMLFAGALTALPSVLLAKKSYAAWPKTSFDIKDLTDSVKSVYGHNNLEESSKVNLKAPPIAENGAIVPINVSTSLDNVDSIMIFVENNPQPLSSGYQLTQLAEPSIGTRLKMGKTSNVMAAVKSGDKVYTSTQEVKVTIGGCGG
jgi:sulfur-oxidizing protein SoxY